MIRLRTSLAAPASARQLEQYLGCSTSQLPPAFLLPSFAFTSPPTTPGGPRTGVQADIYRATAGTETRHNRGTSTGSRDARRRSASPSASSWQRVDNVNTQTLLIRRSAHTAAAPVTSFGATHEDLGEEERVKDPAEATWDEAEDLNPHDMITRTSHISEPSPSTSSTQRQATSAVTGSPASRKELMQHISRIPRDAPLEHFLALRNILKSERRMDDSGPVTQLAAAAVRAGHLGFARRLLKQATTTMLAPGAKPRYSIAWVLESSVQRLVRRELWNDVVAFTNIAVAREFNSIPLIAARVRAFWELKRYGEAIEAFELFKKHGLKPTGDAYDDLVSSHLLNANINAAQVSLGDKADHGYPTTVRTCLALLDGMWMYGGNSEMEQKVLDQADAADLRRRKAFCQNARILNRILSVRASRGDFEDALSMLKYYKLETTSPLHQVIAQMQSPNAASELSHWRPSPDIATVVILIGICLRQRHLDLASALFIQSQNEGLGLNEHLVAAVVRTRLAQDDVDGAERFVFDLAAGNATLANPRPGDELRLPKVEPTPMVYEVLLQGVLRYRGLVGAAELLHKVAEQRHDLSLPVTEGMVAALVEYISLDRKEQTEISAELLVRMSELTQGRRKPTIGNLNALLEAAWKNQRFRQSTLVHGRRQTRGREHQHELAKAALFPVTAVDTAGSPLDGRTLSSSPTSSTARVATSLVDRDLQPDRLTTRQQLRDDTLYANIDAMWDYLQTSLIDRGMRPTHAHLAVILRAYIRLGDAEGALNALRRSFDQLGVTPHVSLYSVVIGGVAKLGKVDKAMAVFRDMRERGLEPDRNLYAALAMNFARRQDPKGVRAIWDQAKEKLQNPAVPLSIDPVFVSIYYRALVGCRHVLEAQHVMKRKLDEGMKPDEATLRALERTRRHLRWKVNQATQGSTAHGTSVRQTMGRARAEAIELNLENVKRVRTIVRASKPQGKHALRQLKQLEEFLEDGRVAAKKKGGTTASGQVSEEQ